MHACNIYVCVHADIQENGQGVRAREKGQDTYQAGLKTERWREIQREIERDKGKILTNRSRDREMERDREIDRKREGQDPYQTGRETAMERESARARARDGQIDR